MTLELQTSLSTDSSLDNTSLGSWDFVPELTTTATEPAPPERGNGNSNGDNWERHPQAHRTRTLAPNLTRRSHKKSRGGCYSCKSRKIKCGEQKPACGSCAIKGLNCTYPTEPVKRQSSSSARGNDRTSTTSHTLAVLRRNPTTGPSFSANETAFGSGGGAEGRTFSMLDMRFFHHFLTIAYPHLPVGNDTVWVHEIPQFAERHGYLMHAILSLGASHLSRLTGVDYRRESLVHRGQAIAGLNQALSQWQTARRYGESDAMLAACYALTFQALYMGDGLADFVTMVRGCALTTEKIRHDNSPTAFNLQPDYHLECMAPRLQQLPSVDPRLLEDAGRALDEIRPYMSDTDDDNDRNDHDTELDFHDALVDAVAGLQASPASGYLQFISIYGVWYEMPHDRFKTFLDPDNLVAQLLLAYFVCLQLLMVPLAAHEWPHRADILRVRVLSGTVEWAEAIFDRLEASDLRGLLDWPREIIAIVRAEINGQVLQSTPVLQLHLAENNLSPQSTVLMAL
ncbi:hypothetical protein A1O1_04610 [Capronia coronata CBS 617.96]|uniref:Zn(2)-C6 fungal-type domain-containing protein n=1 Tax=Capronia coronata CBS 617.96 TaxID=1182541 RepID=W9YEJ1_9EURO|nr:uncharacterized protein A1O1_04610 [Capronia coronata CBS 617.96]EXJ87686.1 hypothetical protein A1O1_04610 [Capronia coronata CBS 617.96]